MKIDIERTVLGFSENKNLTGKEKIRIIRI